MPEVDLNSPFAIDDQGGPYAEIYHPPLHPNCLLGETPILAPGAIKGFVGAYDGPIMRIVFDGGAVSVTPNHLFLTPKGFASAASLRERDDIIYYAGFERIVFGDPNDNRQPATIKDIVTALAKAPGMSTARVPVAAEYLHGDAAFVNGHIDVVAPNGFLWTDGNAARSQGRSEEPFTAGNSTLPQFACEGNLAPMLFRLRDATDGGMGVRRVSPAFIGRHSSGANRLGSRTVPDGDASLNQALFNGWPADAEFLTNCQKAFPGQVVVRKIRHIESFHSVAPVYDVETESSLYIANGLVSSNCQCSMMEVFI